jgi:hypothetical protein
VDLEIGEGFIASESMNSDDKVSADLVNRHGKPATRKWVEMGGMSFKGESSSSSNSPLKTTLFQTEWKWVENPNRHPKNAPYQAELRPVSTLNFTRSPQRAK